MLNLWFFRSPGPASQTAKFQLPSYPEGKLRGSTSTSSPNDWIRGPNVGGGDDRYRGLDGDQPVCLTASEAAYSFVTRTEALIRLIRPSVLVRAVGC